jgi:exonuclease III
LILKVITWNCNQNFKTKYQVLESYDADIMVVQECESLPQDFLPKYNNHWHGLNKNKGISLFCKTSSNVSNNFLDKYIYALPIEFTEFNLLAVWSFNHRAEKFGENKSGYLIEAISYYKEWLDSKSKGLILGDFNHSSIWDKKMLPINTFQNLEAELSKSNFHSIYHNYFSELNGTESSPTLYWRKNKEHKYHIDYMFSKGFETKDFFLSSFDETIKYSDHMFLVASLE